MVSFFLQQGGGVLNRYAIDKTHGENILRAPVPVQLWHNKTSLACDYFGVFFKLLAFSLVVCFFVKLLTCFLQIRRKIKPGRQQSRHPHESSDIGHITVDALGDTRILHFDGQIPAVFQLGAVHLSDGGGSDGPNVKTFEGAQPVGRPLRVQHLFKLLRRHEMRIVAQARHDL